MILLLVSLWAAGAAVPTDTLSPHPAVHRDTGPPGTVAVHRQPALPMVSLRLSLLADDPPGYAGAGHFQQHLVFPTLREEAARVGGHAQVTRTADALVYTVTGPAAELTYLARVLRSALAVPASGQGQMLAAARDLAEERNAEWETAPQHVRARLRGRLFPWQLPAAGTHSSALRLDLASVRAAWAAMYRPERVAVVAVGDVQR
ncbi:MAG: hypothetical protein M3409_04285, partial [Gemmatimonadota bacterium]|nr:hypothetical protein [Gemmatimonadota bacterium]